MVVVLRHISRGRALLQEVYQYAVLINTSGTDVAGVVLGQ